MLLLAFHGDITRVLSLIWKTGWVKASAPFPRQQENCQKSDTLTLTLTQLGPIKLRTKMRADQAVVTTTLLYGA